MKVYFGCDASAVRENPELYVKIRDSINSLGHSLTRDWIPESITNAEKQVSEELKDYYALTIEAVLIADAVVIEGSRKSTSMGHLVTLALQKSKPVLFMYKKDSNGDAASFIDGIDDDMFVKREYSDDQINFVLEDFLNNRGWGAKIRFNMFLDKELDSYLNWAAFSHNTNKTKVVKDAIRKVMLEDQGYHEYTKSK